jgi:hypothetical protein
MHAIFEVKHTKDIDVYKLYLSETTIIDNKKLIKGKKIGIAYIPTLECSVMCREIFEKNTASRILMECKFIPEKNKWLPIQLDVNNKYPTDLSEIRKKMEVHEEISSEDDFD